MSKQIEETVEKILSLIGQINAEEKASTLNRNRPIAPCEIIDELEEKPNRCRACPLRGQTSQCECQIIDERRRGIV